MLRGYTGHNFERGAAMVCFVVGLPEFFLRNGSLAPSGVPGLLGVLAASHVCAAPQMFVRFSFVGLDLWSGPVVWGWLGSRAVSRLVEVQ